MIKISFEKKKTKKKRFKEFSKKALAVMIFLWFFGALFAFAVVAVQIVRGDLTVNLSDLLLYISTPMTGGILGYMLKSAVENREKIKKENTYENIENETQQP